MDGGHSAMEGIVTLLLKSTVVPLIPVSLEVSG